MLLPACGAAGLSRAWRSAAGWWGDQRDRRWAQARAGLSVPEALAVRWCCEEVLRPPPVALEADLGPAEPAAFPGWLFMRMSASPCPQM